MTRVDRPSDCEVVFSRLLDAPRQVVWDAWTTPEQIHQWWGPDGFTTTTHEFAFVVGGVWRHIMHGPNGFDCPTLVVFREIDAPSRLVYDNGWDVPGAPVDFSVVATFETVGTKTRFTLHMTFPSAEAVKAAVERYGVLQGGIETFERLERFVRTLS